MYNTRKVFMNSKTYLILLLALLPATSCAMESNSWATPFFWARGIACIFLTPCISPSGEFGPMLATFIGLTAVNQVYSTPSHASTNQTHRLNTNSKAITSELNDMGNRLANVQEVGRARNARLGALGKKLTELEAAKSHN